jgi:hypothetical protein
MMPEAARAAAGTAAVFLGLASYAAYIRSVVRPGAARTEPERLTWMILTAEYCCVAWAQFAKGITVTAWLVTAYGVGAVTVAALSLRYGVLGFGPGHREPRLEHARQAALAACVAGALVAWRATRDPAAAIGILVAVEATAIGRTAVKAWRLPGTESRLSWLLSAAAGLLAIAAVSVGDPPVQYAYPAMLAAAAAAVLAGDAAGRRRAACQRSGDRGISPR